MRVLSSSNGDGWRAWYDSHAGNLLLFARQWLPCRADAEDALQAGFVKFWKSKPQPDAEDLPLLYTAVRSAALDLLKSGIRRARREDNFCAEETELWWDADAVTQREQANLMRQALSGLSEDQREVLVMRVWGELTFAQIASALDTSLNTITSRYRYALSNLKKLLPEDCHERIGS